MAAALVLALAVPCDAMPAAGAYPSRLNALDAANDLEMRLLDAINADRAARGLPALKWSALLSAVAREHAEDMAAHDYVEDASPRLGTLEYRLHRAGASAPNSQYAVFRIGTIEGVMESMESDATPFHTRPATQIGLGVVAKGLLPRALYIALIAGEKHTVLDPFPTRPDYGKGYWLKGRLALGFAEPKLIVTLPSGKVVQETLALDRNRRFRKIVYFDRGKGEYVVEITASGKLGPMVLELMRCYAGVPYPPPEPDARRVAVPRDLRQAERLMFEMINRARAEARPRRRPLE